VKVVIAPDSFKECLSASAVAQAMEKGVKRAVPEWDVELVPMADGGEGTVDALVEATGGRLVSAKASGPLGEPLQARYGVLGDGSTAVVEIAAASGLPLVPPGKRNPMLTSSYGTGELLLHALDSGIRRFIVAVGGSATVDGGAGIAQALGVGLLDADGRPVCRGGAGLRDLVRIDLDGVDERLAHCEVVVACDVDNPLCGPTGAAAVYGPQKGATEEMVPILDEALRGYAGRLREAAGRDFSTVPGVGAAGGAPLSLLAFMNAELKSGIRVVIDAVGLKQKLGGAQLVLTGEGKLDGQSCCGKAVWGVSVTAFEAGVPVVVITGSVEEGVVEGLGAGVAAVFSIAGGPMSREQSMLDAESLLERCCEQVLRLYVVGFRAS